jgi:hypothetical protein
VRGEVGEGAVVGALVAVRVGPDAVLEGFVGDQVAALELAAVVVGEHELEGEQLGARAGVELELDAVGGPRLGSRS